VAAGQSLLLLYYAQLKADKMESVCNFCDWEKTALDQISFSLVDNLILSSLGMRILQETVLSKEWRKKKILIPGNTSSKMATRQLAPSEREEGVGYNLNCPHWRSSLTR